MAHSSKLCPLMAIILVALLTTIESATTTRTSITAASATVKAGSAVEKPLRGSDIGSEEAESLTNEVRLNPNDFLRQDSKIANARLEMSPIDKTASAGHHYGKGHHGKYYQFVEVPKKGAFKMGFKRGNHKHWIMRKESQHGPHNHGYFKWQDKKGKGSHKWEYNHYKHKKHHHH